jgi:hypothetical protein
VQWKHSPVHNGQRFFLAAECVKNSYTKVRDQKIRETILVPWLGPDFQKPEQLGVNLPAHLQPQPNFLISS